MTGKKSGRQGEPQALDTTSMLSSRYGLVHDYRTENERIVVVFESATVAQKFRSTVRGLKLKGVVVAPRERTTPMAAVVIDCEKAGVQETRNKIHTHLFSFKAVDRLSG